MGTGYTRNDTANNIADGNVINAADLDGEFDAVQSAFNASSGHSHDGTTGEGPQIDASGIANNAVALGTKTTGNYVAAGAVAGTGLSGSAGAEGATFTVTSNATNLNTGSTIVARDSSGNFTAGTITASLTGNVTGNVSGTAGSATGNAATATALQTARNIGGVSFDGTGNIDLPGVNTGGNQDTSGNAATATALASARTIGGVSFDGTGNINLPGVNTGGNQATSGNAATATALETARNIHGVSFDGTGNIDLSEVIQDTVGAMFTGNTETNITATYEDSDGTIDLVVTAPGIASLADDSSPQLGANLDLNGFSITGSGIIPSSLISDTRGTTNIAIGGSNFGSITSDAAAFNSAFGDEALKDITSGDSNTAIGKQALESVTTGSNNTGVGAFALDAIEGVSDTTGIGYASLGQLTTGTLNTAVGAFALVDCVSGNNNTAVGYHALTNATASSNTAVGRSAGDSITSGSNLTCIGDDADASAVDATNEITLGNSSVATLRCQVQTISSLSDERDKENIQPLDAGIEFVKGLKPVSFDWNMRDGGKVGIADTGFIAQDLQQVQKETGVDIPYLVLDNNPDKLEAGYSKLLPVLVKAIQEQQKTIEELEARVTTLQKDLA